MTKFEPNSCDEQTPKPERRRRATAKEGMLSLLHATQLRRREFLVLGAGTFAIATLPWLVREKRRLVRRSLPVMGTIAEIGIVHEDEHVAQRAIDAAFAALQSVERRMTRFDPNSEVGRANHSAFWEPTRISVDTAQVIAAALHWAQASDGRFDPALGRLVELWDVNHRQVPPEDVAVRKFASRNLYRAIDVVTQNRVAKSAIADSAPAVVRFTDPEVAIDLGGIAKGYGVDRAIARLREMGVTSALVNVGGDLYALGHSVSGEAWRVGILDPLHPEQILQSFELSDAAVATSGDYFQFFEHHGRRYHHLLDPKTAAPHKSVRNSLTVMADRCLDADAAATALFGLEEREALQVLRAAAPEARIIAG